MSDQATPTPSESRLAINETRVRVRYAETDQMGVVYHANHFIWFEVGRVNRCASWASPTEMSADIASLGGDARRRYKALLYDDEVLVRTLEEHTRTVHWIRTRACRNWRMTGRGRNHAHRSRLRDEAKIAAEKYMNVPRSHSPQERSHETVVQLEARTTHATN